MCSFRYLGRVAPFVVVAHPGVAIGGIRNLLLRDPFNCSTGDEVADLGGQKKMFD